MLSLPWGLEEREIEKSVLNACRVRAPARLRRVRLANLCCAEANCWRMNRRLLPVLSAASLLLASCGRPDVSGQGSVAAAGGQQGRAVQGGDKVPDKAEDKGTGAGKRVFDVKGLVISLKPEEKSVEIKHEAIPGYMQAMTMSFDVKNTNELSGLEAGDAVSFRLTVTDTNGWIDRVHKTGRDGPAEAGAPASNSPPASGLFRLVREVEPLNVGDPLPEYHLTNELGQPISTAQFKGQALAITFLFTRCPFPTFCPLMSRDFAEAQAKLLSQPGGPTNWHLLTISFDPEFDKPAVLNSYAQAYKYDPAHWSFATGALIDITAIGEQLGLTFWHDETGSISHNLRTAVVDASGRVQKIFIGNKWAPEDLVEEITKAAKQ
jgi:protein SCO1/2